MRVLVTGHEGYLGSVVCRALALRDHQVVGLDTGWFRDCLVGPAPVDPAGHRGDLRAPSADWLTGIDAVVSLAALCNDAIGSRRPELTMAINGDATIALARAAQVAGVRRFVQSSTCSVYGDAASDVLLDETGPTRPLTAYAVAKIDVEEALAGLATETFVPVCLRNATAFGFSPRLRLDIVVNEFTASAQLTGVVRVQSDGTPWRPYVHVTDISHAMVAAVEATPEQLTDTVVNVGDESLNLQVRQVAEVVAKATGADLELAARPRSDGRSYRVSFARLREMFPDLPPPISLEAGVAELVEAFRQHGLSELDRRQRLRRLAWLEHLGDTDMIDADLRWKASA